jgi:hypothetical protein
MTGKLTKKMVAGTYKKWRKNLGFNIFVEIIFNQF